jgi:hypothetical protein
MQPVGGVDLLTHCQHVDALVNSFWRALHPTSVNVVLPQKRLWKLGCMHRVMQGNKGHEKNRELTNWRSLAQRASVEMDPEKLLNLVSELNSALEHRERNYCISDRNPHRNKSKEWNSHSGFTPRV